MSIQTQAPGPRPRLASGARWRRGAAKLGFIEVVAESIGLRRLPAGVEAARERGLAVIPHGIRLSLGGAEHPDARRLEHLASVAERVCAPLVSEHIAFVRAHGQESGHLLPVPRTHEALQILAENVTIAQRALPVPLALEHVATLVEWPDAEMDEATFSASCSSAPVRCCCSTCPTCSPTRTTTATTRSKR